MHGDGNIFTCTKDMEKYCRALRGVSFLSAHTKTVMFTPGKQGQTLCSVVLSRLQWTTTMITHRVEPIIPLQLTLTSNLTLIPTQPSPPPYPTHRML